MKEKDLFSTVLFGGFRKTDVLEYIMSFEGKQDSDRSVLEENIVKLQAENKTVTEELKTAKEALEGAEEELENVKEDLELTGSDLKVARSSLDTSVKECEALKREFDATVNRLNEAAEKYRSMDSSRAEAVKDLEAAKRQLEELTEKNKQLSQATVNRENGEAAASVSARCRELERQLEEAERQIRVLTSSKEKDVQRRTADASYSMLLMKENVMDVVENYRVEMQTILRNVKETALTECDRLKKKNEELTGKLNAILDENRNLYVELNNSKRELSEVRRQYESRASSESMPVIHTFNQEDTFKTRIKPDEQEGMAGCLQGARDRIDSLVKETANRLDKLFSDVM